MSEMATVYLGLGANLGDRENNLRRALELLSRKVKIECLSSLYETEPESFLPQPAFLNAVCRIATSLTPQELLGVVKDIERELGRQPAPPNSPRPVDIDILFYGDLVLDTEKLTIPHPRLAQRAFVLVPLAEVAPGLVHPQSGKQAQELLGQVNKKGVALWKGAIRLRGHHLMCLIGFRGYGYSDSHRGRLADIQGLLFSQPFTRIEVVKGADDICGACPWLKQRRCCLDDEDDQEVRIREKDERVLAWIGLGFGFHTWGEVLNRIREHIKREDLANLCFFCSWYPLGFCDEAWEKLSGHVRSTSSSPF